MSRTASPTAVRTAAACADPDRLPRAWRLSIRVLRARPPGEFPADHPRIHHRCGRRRAEDALDFAQGGDRPVVGGARCAAGGRLQRLLQVLLDLRLTPRRQHRPRRRTRCSMRSMPSRRSTQSGLSRRTAAPSSAICSWATFWLSDFQHAPSPAEFNDGFQPGARAGAPDQPQGRAGAAEAGAGGLGGPACGTRQAFSDGVRHVVVDAVADTDLGIIGEAVGDDLLVTGGSGVALACPLPIAAADFWSTRPMPTRCPRSPAPPPCWRARSSDLGTDRSLQGAAPAPRHGRHSPWLSGSATRRSPGRRKKSATGRFASASDQPEQ